MVKQEETIDRNLERGQHFLIDSDIIKKEIEIANISKKDKIIEIGAGEGNLTLELAKKAGKVLAFEIDKRYSKKLDSLEKNYKNLKLIYDDALNYSWKKYTKIVSNIPYSISEQLINKSIEDEIPEMVLIIGEKLKEKIQEDKSKIGMVSNLFYDIQFITKVGKDCFFPKPRVDSWLIKFKKRNKFSEIERILISILKRKGKLKNAILYSFVEKGKTKRGSKEIIKKMDLHEYSLGKPTANITGRMLMRLKKELEKLKI